MPHINYRVQFLLHRIRFQNINLYAFTAYYRHVNFRYWSAKSNSSVLTGKSISMVFRPKFWPLSAKRPVKMDCFVHFLRRPWPVLALDNCTSCMISVTDRDRYFSKLSHIQCDSQFYSPLWFLWKSDHGNHKTWVPSINLWLI